MTELSKFWQGYYKGYPNPEGKPEKQPYQPKQNSVYSDSLAGPGKARGCSTTTAVIYQLIQWVSK